jgi:hypothetical protein
MSETVRNQAEKEFEDKIKSMLEGKDLSIEVVRRNVSNEMNLYLRSINKLNHARDIVADIFVDSDNKIHVDIFCRNEKMDILALQLADMIQKKDNVGIAKIQQTLERIKSINAYNVYND